MALSREELVKLSRRELQKYAKEHGVRANMKNAEIGDMLLDNAEAQEPEDKITREQEAPTNTVKQEGEVVENGLTATDAAIEEPNTIKRRCESLFAKFEERGRQEAAARANAAAQLPTPDDSTGQDAQSQSAATGSPLPLPVPSSPVARTQARTRPLTPIPPKPEILRVGPNFARFEQRKQPDEQTKQTEDNQTKESSDRRPVVKRTVQGAPVGMKLGEWSQLMNKVSDFEHTRINIVDAVDEINVLVGRGENHIMRIQQGLDGHQRVRHQLERYLTMMSRTTSALDGGSGDDESGESPQQDERVELGKRRRDDEDEDEDGDEDDGENVFGSPSYKRRRTDQ